MSLEHGAGGHGANNQPVKSRRGERSDDQDTLSAFLACHPVGLDERRRNEARVEVEVSEQEGGGREGLEREVEGLQSGLKGAEGLAGERLVRLVAGLCGEWQEQRKAMRRSRANSESRGVNKQENVDRGEEGKARGTHE